jgi:nitroreductase
MALLDLDPDQLLSTTRAVRKRLDFARPVLVLGCNEGTDRTSALAGLGNILPATWSFMLAARARGLGTAWTSMRRPDPVG